MLCTPQTVNGQPVLPKPGYMGEADYDWGPESKIVRMTKSGQQFSLHWDGNELLYISSGGSIQAVDVGGDAVIAGGALTALDRDWNGLIPQVHNASGYSAWIPPNAYRTSCTPNAAPPGTPNWVAPTTWVLQTSLDGYYDNVIYFQGARTYDPQKSQWTTPDAASGSPEDPVSQKPYIWNRNNSYDYQDPSGYEVFNYCLECGVFGRPLNGPTTSELNAEVANDVDVATYQLDLALRPAIRAERRVLPTFLNASGCGGFDAASLCFSFSLDQRGRFYPGINYGAGHSWKVPAYSGSVTANWLWNDSDDNVADSLHGWGGSVGGGDGYGGQLLIDSPEHNFGINGFGVGVFSPQVGVQYGRSKGPYGGISEDVWPKI